MIASTVVEIDVDKSVSDIIKETVQEGWEDPFYVVDLGDIAYKYNLWKKLMPRVHPYYAVKCNDCPTVLDLLVSLGAGFDCASKREIDAVLKSGANSSSIIYANPCKASSFIKHAASMGVDIMTFDNELELYKIKKLFPCAKMVLRIKVDDSKSICQLGMKFGCYEEHIPNLLRIAKGSCKNKLPNLKEKYYALNMQFLKRKCEAGIEVSQEAVPALNIVGDSFHPEYNYTTSPRVRYIIFAQLLMI